MKSLRQQLFLQSFQSFRESATHFAPISDRYQLEVVTAVYRYRYIRQGEEERNSRYKNGGDPWTIVIGEMPQGRNLGINYPSENVEILSCPCLSLAGGGRPIFYTNYHFKWLIVPIYKTLLLFYGLMKHPPKWNLLSSHWTRRSRSSNSQWKA